MRGTRDQTSPWAELMCYSCLSLHGSHFVFSPLLLFLCLTYSTSTPTSSLFPKCGICFLFKVTSSNDTAMLNHIFFFSFHVDLFVYFIVHQCNGLIKCLIKGVFLNRTQCFWDWISSHHDPYQDKAVPWDEWINKHLEMTSLVYESPTV